MYLRVLGTQQPVTGELAVPTSKYHAHRALILASLADGESRIVGPCDARHVESTISVLRGLGRGVEATPEGFTVNGGPYSPTRASLSVGSSGTTLYFMIGLSCLADSPVTITGQKYFQRRPVGPLLEALTAMGVRLQSANGRPPITVHPGRPPGGRVTIGGTLSQWISGLLLLAPFAQGPTTIEVEGVLNESPYLALTVEMMRKFGLAVEVAPDWRSFTVEGNQTPHPATVVLPPDLGSAAFGLAAAALHPADVRFRGLAAGTLTPAGTHFREPSADPGAGPSSGSLLSGHGAGGADPEAWQRLDHPEAEVIEVMRQMGVPMSHDPASGTVTVRHDGAPLHGVEVDCRKMPDMLPVLSALAARAEGVTTFRNIAHVRLKESDRVAAMQQLSRMGASAEMTGDDLIFRGVSKLSGAPLSSYNDHRVLMALAVAASSAEGESTLTYPRAYRISYPSFLEDMSSLGLSMTVQREGTPRRGAPRRESVAVDRASETPIVEQVRRWALERPSELGLVDASGDVARAWSWRKLCQDVDRAAALLLDLGVQPGEPVAFQLPNVGEFTVLSLAILRIGAVCCPLMPIFREREISLALERSRARVLVVADRFRRRSGIAETAALLASGAGGSVEHVLVLSLEAPSEPLPGDAQSDGSALSGAVGFDGAASGHDTRAEGHDTDDHRAEDHDAVAASARARVRWQRFSEAVAAVEVDPAALDARSPAADAPAQLLFTSGTTGEPKGVIHPFDTLTRAVAMEIEHLGLGRDDRVFIPSPLAHQTGFLYGMWLALFLGVPQILQATWDPRQAVATLREWGGSFVQAATPFLSDLLSVVESGEEPPSTLRVFVVTGAAVPRALASRATEALGTSVCGAWGSTETCLGTLSAPDDPPEKVWGTDGRPLAGVDVRIVDDSGRPLPAGAEGNFELLSRCFFTGYLDRPDLTAEAFAPDGWYRTGDLALFDEAGFLHITGRVKDVINRGGEKIPVAEIEQILHTHPAVADVAIVAMPDPRLGERACAFVVPTDDTPGISFDEMTAHLDAAKVAKQYWPERLEEIDELPRNAVGKIQKFALRELARELADSPTPRRTPKLATPSKEPAL